MNRSGFRALAVAATVPLLAGCVSWNSYETATEERRLTAPGDATQPVEVRTHNGSIRIEVDPSAPEFEILATVKAAGDTYEEAEVRLALVEIHADVDSMADTLVIEPYFPGGRRNGDGCSFSIVAPGFDGFVGRSSNGSIELSGGAGLVNLDTSNGAIAVWDHDGDLRAATSNGRITVERVQGAITAHTSNGRVNALEVVGGPVTIRTSNGRVTYSAGPDSIGPFRINTSNGSVEVMVPPSIGGEIVASTSNGRVSVDDAGHARRVAVHRSSAAVTLSDTGPRSHIETSNGSVTIRIRE